VLSTLRATERVEQPTTATRRVRCQSARADHAGQHPAITPAPSTWARPGREPRQARLLLSWAWGRRGSVCVTTELDESRSSAATELPLLLPREASAASLGDRTKAHYAHESAASDRPATWQFLFSGFVDSCLDPGARIAGCRRPRVGWSAVGCARPSVPALLPVLGARGVRGAGSRRRRFIATSQQARRSWCSDDEARSDRPCQGGNPPLQAGAPQPR
jgi:hypothetical protein